MTRQEERGYLLPENLDPPLTCICLNVPCDKNHALALLGQIAALGYWWTWERDALKRGTQAARVWRDIYDDVNRQLNECGVFSMSGCGCNDHEGRLSRINDDGVYQISDDGGETWVDAPELDPRNTSTQFPPLPGSDSDTKRCAGADNFVANFESLVNTAHDQITAGAALFTVIDVIAGIVAIFLSAGTLFFVIAPFGAALFGLGAAGIAAAFTDEVWDKLKCAVYCHSNDDASVTDTQIGDILSKVDTDITGAANPIIHLAFGLMGAVGVTNWMRTGSATGDDCEDCDCNPPCEEGCDTYQIDLTNSLNDLPDGWSITGEHFAINDSNWNEIYPSYPAGTGEGYADINFPLACVAQISFGNLLAAEGDVTFTIGDFEETVTDYNAAGSVTPTTPQRTTKIRCYSPNGHVGLVSIHIAFCVEG